MVALVTGGSKGIGAQTVKNLAKNGYSIAINYNTSKANAEYLKCELNSNGLNAEIYKADVSKKSEVEAMIRDIESKQGNINILVNNAGIAQQKLFSDITSEDFDRMFDVNVKGVFNCCKAVLPYMVNVKKGNIINISSMWGQVGASCEVHYSASKAAVIGLTKALAKEVGLSGIRVNCVCPGVVETEMNSHLDEQTIEELKEETPLNMIGKPEDVADTVEFLCSEKSRYITGQVIGVNGGMII